MAAAENNVDRMRQDAVRRAQEMYRRAQAPAGYSGTVFSEEKDSEEKTEPKEKPTEENQENKEEKTAPDFFTSLYADKERSLILGVLMILMEEKDTDPSLLFALLYLLL